MAKRSLSVIVVLGILFAGCASDTSQVASEASESSESTTAITEATPTSEVIAAELLACGEDYAEAGLDSLENRERFATPDEVGLSESPENLVVGEVVPGGEGEADVIMVDEDGEAQAIVGAMETDTGWVTSSLIICS